MKSVANWYVRVGALVLILAITVAALACGGNGGSVNLSPTASNTPGSSASSAAKSTGVLVTESEIPTLPAWQQELLSDSGWNQPYIEPREETPIMAPTNEFFEETLEETLARGEVILPRTADTGKSVSWDKRGDFVPGTQVGKGQYDPDDAGVGETPGFGCNVDPTNDFGSASAGSDDPIAVKPVTGSANQRISYVHQGITQANHFNGDTGGVGNDALSCVYQLFSNNNMADPLEWEEHPEFDFAELAYRSDLGGNRTTGAPCAAVAYQVSGQFWKAFCKPVTALPYGDSTAAYNILVAPASEVGDEYESSGDTMARCQDFYLGHVRNCYGAGMIVGISSTSSSCDRFNVFVDQANTSKTAFFHLPIYGVLLKRWQDTTPAGSAGPWEGIMGWPVHGPISFHAGEQTMTARGSYFAWGMWFETGFVWWIDYNQVSNPTTPDEGQAYLYTGTNVYCKDGGYEKIGTAYYGGAGDLAATVSVDGYRDLGDTTWKTADFQNNQYLIPLSSEFGLETVEVALTAHPYGGVPRASDCAYKFCTWAFRDGIIATALGEYDQDQFSVTHDYGRTDQNLEGTYVVRVQVVDSVNAKGYGDSYPIVIGHGSGAGASLLVVRNDGGNYGNSYDAIIDDLQLIADDANGGTQFWEEETVSYTGALSADPTDYAAVLWYRGGSSTATSPQTTAYSAQTTNDLLDIMDAGIPLLHMSGNASALMNTFWWVDGNGGGSGGYWDFSQQYSLTYTTTYGSAAWDADILALNQYEPIAGWGVCGSASGLSNVPYDDGPWNVVATSTQIGERFTGNSSSSGRQMIQGNVPQQCQMCVMTNWNSGQSASLIQGLYRSPLNEDFISWGDATLGGGMYFVGYPWVNLQVSTSDTGDMQRYHVLQNILAGLAPTFVAGSTGSSFAAYDGQAEIISVTPISWESVTGVNPGFKANQTWYDGTTPAGQYPDFSGTDIYRDTPGGAGTNYIVDGTAVKNEDGLNPNDIDFQFPFYGYWYDDDGSLLTVTPTLTGDEVWLGRGGLLVEDPDGYWTRIEPQQEIAAGGAGAFIDVGPFANYNAFANYDTNAGTPEMETLWGGEKTIPFAGFYVTGNSAITSLDDPDDTGIRASYGDDGAHITFNHDIEPLFFECVAHWAGEQDPANTLQLEWSMFPGDCVDNPTFKEYGFGTTSWSEFILEHDIDPLVTYDPLAQDTYVPYIDRDSVLFLRYDDLNRNRGDETVNRRVVEFDYGTLTGFTGDLDADGTAGEPDDKFPVRVRLVTDNYVGLSDRPVGYPAHWPNASAAHTGWIEGGCYVTSSGTGSGSSGPPGLISVSYDPYRSATEYFWTGTYPSAPSWQMDVTIEVGSYPGPVNFDFDLNVNPLEFIDPFTAPASFTPVAGLTQTGAQGTNVFTVPFTAAQAEQATWVNGTQVYFGVKAYSPADPSAACYMYCPEPLWLGDVILFEDCETGGPSIYEDTTWWNWMNHNGTWHYQNKVGGSYPAGWAAYPRVAASNSRSWFTPVPSMGAMSLFISDNAGGNTLNCIDYRTELLPPLLTTNTTNEVYLHWRGAGIMGAADYLGDAVADMSDGQAIGWSENFFLQGSLPTSSVYTITASDGYGGTNFINASGEFRVGWEILTTNVVYSPGGVVLDNMLWSHAQTPAPFI